MLCMFIEPGLASLPNKSIWENQETLGAYKISENLKKGEVSLYAINGKKNLTESQKKLSTALLLQTPALNSTSPLIKSASQSSLTMKNIPVDLATRGLQSTTSKLPSGNLVYVYINVIPGYSTHITDSLAFEVTDRDEENHLAAAWVDVHNLETLASLEGVRTITEVIPPFVNMGSVTTQGDLIHKTNEVRSRFGYSGAGMKIGIISNGVDHIAASIASGDLPPDVTVLSNTWGGDEGTAMLEIVHDMVPGAKLYFHDHGSNIIAFNAAIDELQANGCKVICDDVGWTREPFFEDGIVASHVSDLVTNSNNPLVYVSSSGNSASEHYQGEFSDDGMGYNNKYLYVNMPTGSSIFVVLEWNDQFGHSANDYDLVLFDATSYAVLSYSENTQSGTQDPIEAFSYSNSGSARAVEIDVSKYSGVAKTLEIFIYPSGGASVYTNNIVAADSIFGHPAVPDVIAVAAVPASSPTTIESFSSRGPVTISYPFAVSRSKPDISGVDGVAITGVGGFSNPFYGTSASAPHIAAVVAQYWGAHPILSPAQVRSALYTKAVDLGETGKDTIFGYGRADALVMEGNAVVVNGDKIGVTNGQSWYLDWNGDGVWASGSDSVYNFGAPQWIPIMGDWNATGKSFIGVTNGQQWYLDWNGNGAWDGMDKAYSFGAPGWINVTGDWNHNGKTNIGVTNGQQWYLDWNGNGAWDAGIDRAYNFGAPGWIAIIGDWNGTGKTNIGVTNGQQWYLDWNGNGAWDAGIDRAYNFGAPGWIPNIGDWNNDGKTDISVTNGQQWYLDRNNNGVWDPASDRSYTFGAPGWTPVIGDWNRDGTGTKIGVTNGQQWYLDSNGNGAWDSSSDYAYSLGASGWTPVVGRWTGAAPFARFSGTPTTGTSPLTVAFTDLSANTPTSWNWSFGDGNTSTLQNPSKVYSSPGTYTISLAATNIAGSNSTTKLNYITASSAALVPVAGFSGTPTTGTAPLTVAFTDLSANTPASWNWSFGDGNTSTLQNPSKVYSSPGSYTVSLTATNSAGNNTTIRSNYITVSSGVVTPIAGFTGSPVIGNSPLTVTFTDRSLNNPTGWAWYFGDETYTGSWTEMTSSAGWLGRIRFSSVVMPDGSIVLMGGKEEGLLNLTNDVWRSTNNGADWTRITTGAEWEPREGHSSVVMSDGSIILMGGSNSSSQKNDVWRSTNNGADWTQMTASAEWSARTTHSSVVMSDGSIVLMGGNSDGSYRNDVWRSTDNGATWTQLTGTAEWSGRGHFCSVVMPDGSIVLMGGYDDGENGGWNDVWRSTNNGVNWTQMTANAGWSDRHRHTCIVMPDSSIVLMGGVNSYVGYYNDVWRSTDNGGTWTQLTANAEWSPRSHHNSVALPDGSIVLMGGTYFNDVWRFMPVGSSAQNPLHTYVAPGVYSVALQVYNADGYNLATQTNYVTVNEAQPVAGFSGTPTTGTAPLTVTFTDLSINTPTSWNWSFGDGNTSSASNPLYVYSAPGIYTVNLTATNTAGSDSEVKTDYITVNSANYTQFINPGFEAGNMSGWNSGNATSILGDRSHSGTYSCHLDMSGTQATNYISQSVDLTDAVSITFWGMGESNTWPFYIYIDGTLVQTSNAVSDTWTLYTVPVSSYSGIHNVSIKWNGGPGIFGADVDDFSIS
jgi:PKD repeat protein